MSGSVWLIVAVVLIVLALLVLAWHGMGRSAASLRVFMWLMVLFVLAVGVPLVLAAVLLEDST